MTRDSIAEIAARFARDTGPHEHNELLPYKHIGPERRYTTRPHELTILHDEGVYRHLRFKSPDQGAYWFDLVTWPGCLTVRGDLGAAYTFAERGDMFAFFRGKSIQPNYWSQKLDAKHGSASGYDQDLCEQIVKEHVVEVIRDGRAPRGLGRAVTELLRDGDFGWEDGAYAELTRFEHGAKTVLTCACRARAEFDANYYGAEDIIWRGKHRGVGHFVTDEKIEGFRFHDVYEWRFRDFDWSYLWACHAIVWGIARYDEAKQASAVTS
jgi:hypothetical protein